MTTPRSPSDARIYALQYFRGVAALTVVVYHASQYAILNAGAPAGFSAVWERFAVWGVAVFFALSGFLMARLAPRTAPGLFLAHRLARIYPIFFAIIALYCVLSPLLAGYFHLPRLLSLTLIPAGPTAWSLGGVEWTLLFEVSFYVFMFAVIWARATRLIPVIAVVWLIIIAVRMWLWPEADVSMGPNILLLPVASANIAFACGMLVPAVAERIRTPFLFVLAPVAGFLAWDYVAVPEYRAIAGVCSALAIAATLRPTIASQARWSRWLSQAGLNLGDASYAIYLAHIPLIIAVYRWLPAATPWPVAWILAVLVAVLAGLALGKLDVGMYARLRARINVMCERRLLRLSMLYCALFIAISGWGAVSYVIDLRHRAAVDAVLAVARLDQVAARDTQHEAANARLRAADKAYVAPAGAIDGVQRLPDGKLVISGWVVDLDSPAAKTFVTLFCNGKPAGTAARLRLKPAVAAQLQTPALARQRIGFTLLANSPDACQAGGTVLVLAADARGKGHALPAVTAP